MEENFVALSPAANRSKGARSFAEWTHHAELDVPVDPAFRQQMMARERALLETIRKKIDDLVREQMGADMTPEARRNLLERGIAVE